jgi:hypothetical protein
MVCVTVLVSVIVVGCVTVCVTVVGAPGARVVVTVLVSVLVTVGAAACPARYPPTAPTIIPPTIPPAAAAVETPRNLLRESFTLPDVYSPSSLSEDIALKYLLSSIFTFPFSTHFIYQILGLILQINIQTKRNNIVYRVYKNKANLAER